jgi:hypothetical protein
MMGIGKNEAVYPKALQNVIGEHLRFVYSSIYPELENDFDSRIIEIFGSKYSGINMGMYTSVAKVLDDAGALNMDRDIDTADPEVVKRYLGVRGVSDVVISFIVNEMKGASTLARVMDRMRKCSAGHRLPKLAAEIPPECTSFEELEEGGLQCCIKAVSKTLQKTEQEVFSALKRIKNAQERLSSLSRLAALYNLIGGDEDEKEAALVMRQEFTQFTNKYKEARNVAMEQVKRTASAHEKNGDRNSLVNSLAKEYNGIEGNDDDEKKATLVKLTDFIRLINDHDIGRDDAINLIKDTAEAYVQTFWDNYKKLKEYHTQNGEHDIVEIEGVRILTIRLERLTILGIPSYATQALGSKNNREYREANTPAWYVGNSEVKLSSKRQVHAIVGGGQTTLQRFLEVLKQRFANQGSNEPVEDTILVGIAMGSRIKTPYTVVYGFYNPHI